MSTLASKLVRRRMRSSVADTTTKVSSSTSGSRSSGSSGNDATDRGSDLAGRFGQVLRRAGNVSAPPLVSCIMPTANRRAFVARAIGYFLRQDYPNSELFILDDGTDGVADLVPEDPRVRYERIAPGRTLGAQRNACDEASRGDMILHW